MGSKVIVFLGILLAMVLLISSEVAARELAETSNALDTSSEKTNGAGVDDAKYPGGGGYPGGGYPGGGGYGGGYPGRGGGGYGGGYPGRGGGGYGGGYPGRGGGHGGYCSYGCCGRNYYRGGCRCCSFAGEKADAATQAEPQN